MGKHLSYLIVFILVLVLLGSVFTLACSSPSTSTAPATSKAPATSSAPAPAPSTSATSKPAATPTSQAQQSKTIELKAVTFMPPTDPTSIAFLDLAKRISDKTNGQLSIKYIGGAEAIPAFNQADAVRKDVVDAVCLPASFYRNLLPEVDVYQLSTLTPAQERQGGFWDFEAGRHKSINMFPVSRVRMYEPMYTILKKPVQKSSDLKGLKIGRSSPLSQAFYQALGATVVTVPNSEYYSALERGVVDGEGYPITGFISMSLFEVAKYYIDVPFLDTPSVLFLVNLDKWNSLPPDLQKVIIDTSNAWEDANLVANQDFIKSTIADLAKKGMTAIKFQPDDAKSYRDLAYSTEWDHIKQNAPDIYPNLKKLLGQP